MQDDSSPKSGEIGLLANGDKKRETEPQSGAHLSSG